MLTFDIFKAFWQNVNPHLQFPGTKAGDDATCTEWEEEDEEYSGDEEVTSKCQGMRNAAGLKNGVIRTVFPGDDVDGQLISEATWCED